MNSYVAKRVLEYGEDPRELGRRGGIRSAQRKARAQRELERKEKQDRQAADAWWNND